MLDMLISIGAEIGIVLYEGSLYILVGFIVAGVLKEYLPTEAIARHLGGNDLRSVTLASLFGAPIPLCSCGVLPAAAALRDKGASRPATLSFLISTPETGVDSIALTYGLLGPVMAVVRPIVAIVTGIVAGVVAMVAGEEDAPNRGDVFEGMHDHDHDHAKDEAREVDHGQARDMSVRGRGRRVFSYGFVTLLDELAFWIVVGVALTGVLAAALPDDFFRTVLGMESGLLPMLAMIVVGTPLYLCASASTPVAAALIAKGLSPGAALVFLLVGPATNAATLTVTARMLGARRVRIYLGSIVLVSLAAGLLLDAFGGEALRQTALSSGTTDDGAGMQALKVGAAVVFVALLVASMLRTGFREGLGDLRDQSARLSAALREFDPRSLLRGPVLAGAAVVLALATAPAATLVVEPGQAGIVKRFGRVVAGDLDPGLYFHLPSPLGDGIAVDVDLVRQVAVGFRGATDGMRSGVSEQAYYLTADENIIDIRAVVFYRVDDPVRFALGVESADEVVRSLARRELVDTVGNSAIDTLYTTARRPTEREVLASLRTRTAAAEVGCEIVDVRLLDVHAPADVHDAFRDVGSAIEDRDREVQLAAGYANELRAESEGRAAATVIGARADGLGRRLRAEGEAAAFTGLAAAHARGPSITETRLYLETLERALAAPRKYINGAGADGGEIDLWIGADGSLPQVKLPAVRARDDDADEREAGATR